MRRLIAVAVAMIVGMGLVLSWREEFTPEEGVGYWLGIAGGSALLLLLVYPLRKRMRFMHRFGNAPAWFKFHMMLGAGGPVLILFHSNFSFGATNSNIALVTMLTVAGSGVAGRYIYGKIHNGFDGACSILQDILQEATTLLSVIESDVGGAGGVIAARLTEFGGKALRPRRSMLGNLGTVVGLTFSVGFIRRRILSAVRAAIDNNAEAQGWGREEKRSHYRLANRHLANYLDAVVKASELSFYERLFALWHMLHVPLYLLLLLTGIIHVISVHLY